MKPGIVGLCTFGVVAVCAGRAEPVHPRIYSSEVSRAALTTKIENVAWAGEAYRVIKDSVDPYVDRHVEDPEWMVSRLQMHWRTRYAETYVNGSVWSHGEGEAPVPTVRFAGQRDWNTDYASPALEDIQPYAEDERGIWLQNIKKDDRPWEWAPVQKTGHIPEKINERILELAEKASFLYWYTGEEKYAKFAADIFWAYVLGMYHRGNPQTFEDHSKARIIGLATFEVIHERVTPSLAVSYDYLHDYLVANGRDVELVQKLFQRWADRIIEGGGAEGNWNINQIRYVIYMGLSLEDDAAYADGKGRQHYIRQFTTESSENQRALKRVVPEMYDPVDGVWPEAPGYAFSVTDTILQLSQVIHNATGEDVLEMYPIIVPAATVIAQFLFPNGYTVGFGDTYHELPYMQTLELLVTRSRRLQDREAELKVAQLLNQQIALNGYNRGKVGTLLALTSYVDVLPTEEAAESLQTRTFYADSVNYLAQRNAQNAEDGLMISLAGTRGGHMQANGMAIELYGKGMVMGPDFGRGPSYWTTSHGEFYARFAAHNTVSVDGISDYNSTKRDVVFTIEAIEPASGAHDALSDSFSFSDTTFVEPKTDAEQRRLLSIVRTSDTTGYYVDIFRSRRKDGNDRRHDYIYHNLGQSVRLTKANGDALALRRTKELGTDSGDHKAYNYFEKKQAVDWDQAFAAAFSIALRKSDDVCMGMWMAGQPGRTLFTALSPVSRTINKGSAPAELHDLPVPTVIVRQEGEAWSKPFVAVFEPYGKQVGSSIRSIRALEAVSPAGDFVGLAVETTEHGTQVILNNTDDLELIRCEGIEFAGAYGVVSEDTFYLGQGRKLMKNGTGIESIGQVVQATLEKRGDFYIYSANYDVTLSIEGKAIQVPAARRAVVKL